jgi:hypothetical protein
LKEQIIALALRLVVIKMKQKYIFFGLAAIIICAAIVSGTNFWYNNAEEMCNNLCGDNWDDWGYPDADACWEDMEFFGGDDIDSYQDCVNAMQESMASGGDFDPRDDDWYDVEMWEVVACARHIPPDSPNTVTDLGFPFISEVTYTVLGEWTNLTNPVTGEENYLYEVNFYLYPWEDNYNYAVALSSSESGDDHFLVDWETASADSDTSDYLVVYLPELYDKVLLGLQESGSGAVYTLTNTLADSEIGDRASQTETGIAVDSAAGQAGWPP